MTDHSDLIERLRAAIDLGDRTGARGRRPENIYNVAHEALTALSSQSLSLSEAREENARKDIEIERLKKLSDRYGVALMMIRAGCSDPARFAGNILDDRQPVNVELDEEDFDENHR